MSDPGIDLTLEHDSESGTVLLTLSSEQIVMSVELDPDAVRDVRDALTQALEESGNNTTH